MRFRSVLFSPADKPERVRKALETAIADVVVADLEDGVHPDQKAAARAAAADVLRDVPSADAVRAVRINAWPGSESEADLTAVLPAEPDLIVVPKAESVAAVKALDARLSEADNDARLFLIFESARGVLRALDLIEASDRVVAVAIGAEDLAADAGMRRTPENTEVRTARQLVALAAAAGDVAAVDMITADFRDAERARRESEEARGFGFTGKMIVHPAQVEPVHAGFAPTEDEREWACKVLAAAEGLDSGGVVVVDGQMIDAPLIAQARRIGQE